MSGYERRIGRYTSSLAEAFLGVAGVPEKGRVLDLGCGSGPLSEGLVERLGSDRVVGIDPDGVVLARCAERLPEIELHEGVAERIPFPPESFAAAYAQLVIGLVEDPLAAAGEMARVVEPGGLIAACVWDFGGGMTLLRSFWDAARAVDEPLAAAHDQARTRHCAGAGDLGRLWEDAGIERVETGAVEAEAGYSDFEDLWQPLTIPDGGPGRFCERLDRSGRTRLRERLFEALGAPSGPFRLTARAWYVVGRAGPARR